MFKLFGPKLLDFPFLKEEKEPVRKQLSPLVKMPTPGKNPGRVLMAGRVEPFSKGVSYTGDTFITRERMDIDNQLNSLVRFLGNAIIQDGDRYTFYVHTRIKLHEMGLTYEDVKFNRDDWEEMFKELVYSRCEKESLQVEDNLIGYTDKYIMIRYIIEYENEWDTTYSEEWRFIEK